jgi:hypothetical protein
MKTSAKLAQSIVGTSEGRPLYDFYRTPSGVTLALLGVESFDNNIWEPACGDGAISEVLKSKGYTVISSDIIDRGYGECGKNFFSFTEAKTPTIITNPPFKLAEDFIKHAQRIGVKKIALLLKLAFLEGKSRSRLLERSGLSRIWVFRGRITFTRNGEKQRGSGMIAFGWFVWDNTYKGAPQVGWVDEIKKEDEFQKSIFGESFG